MKVLVIGATGQTGRHAVNQLLARGHEVTAFARNASAFTERREHLRVAQEMHAIPNLSIAQCPDRTP